MACVVIGAVITGLLSVVSGWPGEVHHIGYTVTTRMAWGLRGGLFVSLYRRVLNDNAQALC